jgi:hypothetical protein
MATPKPDRNRNLVNPPQPEETPQLEDLGGGGQGDGKPAGQLSPVSRPKRSDPVTSPKLPETPTGPSRRPIQGGGGGGGPAGRLASVPNQPPAAPSAQLGGTDLAEPANAAATPEANRPKVDTDAIGDPLPENINPPEDSQDDDRPDPRDFRDESDDSEDEGDQEDGQNDSDPDDDDTADEGEGGEAGEEAEGAEGAGAEGAEAGAAEGAEAGAAAAEGAETAAAAAEGTEAAVAILNPGSLTVLLIGVVVFLIAIVVLIVIVGISGSQTGGNSSSNSGNPSTGTPIKGLPDISDIPIKKAPCTSGTSAGGCYVLPPSKYWEIGGPNMTGSKCLVSLIAATSKAWKTANPKDTIYVNALNEAGHLSHQLGNDVDISTTVAANMTVPGYSPEKSIEYGELWFSTQDIEYIFFNDAAVRKDVNAYAQQKNYSGVMQYWPLHENHFHVRVLLDSNGECKNG